MVLMEGAQSSTQISDMFQKFAIAFKTKTYELFADSEFDGDVTLLLDSAEEFIPDQKVVVIKPDSDPHFITSLIPSLFATISSFEASYLQFQAAHVPDLDQTALEQADKSIVSLLQKLCQMRNLYRDSKKRNFGFNCGFEFPAHSFLEFQVQENQSKLRVLETMVNSLQSLMDVKVDEVRDLRKKLDQIQVSNENLTRKLGLKEGNMPPGMEVLLTIRVFEAMLADSVKSLRCFTKFLIDLMSRAGWDLEEASKFVYSGVDYAKKSHNRYAFLSYVCLGMFQNFDKSNFRLCNSSETLSENGEDRDYLRQIIEHVTSNPMDILRKNAKCEFSQFCERKYEELIHPTMESSIFNNLDRKEKVLDSWKSLTVFYTSFVRMASSIWLLHKLAYSFNPVVEIFQVERGVEFSMVYMEDVLGKCSFPARNRPRVGFSVVPGFKVGKTVIQSQVYLTYSKHIE